MVQVNAAWNRRIFYQDGEEFYVTSYVNSAADFILENQKITLEQRQDYLNGSLMNSSENNAKQTVNDIASAYENKPEFKKYVITVHTEGAVQFALNLRIPDWITKKARVFVNEELVAETDNTKAFVTINRAWNEGDKIVVILPIGLKFVTLPDDETMGAYRYGADVLAGITEAERILKLETETPEEELSLDTERQWGEFRTFYRTENQDPGINFRKLNEIGYEPYQIYFKIKH